MNDFGDHFFGEAFRSHFLSDFSEFGRPWESEWKFVGITLTEFLFFLLRRIFDRILIQFCAGPAAGAGVCYVSESAKSGETSITQLPLPGCGESEGFAPAAGPFGCWLRLAAFRYLGGLLFAPWATMLVI
jgi:hypothetical protein